MKQKRATDNIYNMCVCYKKKTRYQRIVCKEHVLTIESIELHLGGQITSLRFRQTYHSIWFEQVHEFR